MSETRVNVILDDDGIDALIVCRAMMPAKDSGGKPIENSFADVLREALRRWRADIGVPAKRARK